MGTGWGIMETAKIAPVENAMDKREVRKAEPPFARECKDCGRKTMDEHETICIECGASTRGK